MLTGKDTAKYTGITIFIIAIFIFISRYTQNTFILILIMTIGFNIFYIYKSYIHPRFEKGNVSKFPDKNQLLWQDEPSKKPNKDKKFQEELWIYETGLRFFKHFFKWNEITQLFFSPQIKGSKAVSNVFQPVKGVLLYDHTTTLTVRTKEKSYFVEIYNTTKFKKVINELKKDYLFK